MNTNNTLNPEETKQQVKELVNNSGIAPEDFIKALADLYNIEKPTNSHDTFDTDYKTYCDGFVE